MTLDTQAYGVDANRKAQTPDVAERVCAVTVTFNREALLRDCLAALMAQTRPIDSILVVNNASSDGTAEMVRREFPTVELLDLNDNIGGAGGFHDGIELARDRGFDWIWLMDDDAKAAPDALEKLLEARGSSQVVVPLQRDSVGRYYGVNVWRGRGVDVTSKVLKNEMPLTGDYLFAFVGPLLSRSIVERIGLPVKEFFIWFDDWEYGLRIHRAGGKVTVVPSAILHHDVGGKPRTIRFLGRTIHRSAQAPWKIYYGARNILYTLVKGKHPLWEIGLFLLSQLKNLVQDMMFESDRFERVRMRLRGLRDGLAGRLGKLR